MKCIFLTLWLLCVFGCVFWVPVFCSGIGCGEPEPLLNGEVKLLSGSQNQRGSLVQYQCNEPYYSLPKEVKVNFTCSLDGKWKDEQNNTLIPHCIPVCGRPADKPEVHGRIWGGKVAPPGYIPWQVLLSNPRGGGMVIGEYWIMTAAHNLHGNTGYKVYVGVNNLLNLPEPLEIASIVLHPKYNGSKGDYDHDIALIYLKHSISFNTNVMPLCLPTNDSKYPTGTNGLVSGFGLMASDMSTNDLMYVEIPVVDQKICRKSIENTNMNLTDNMFCAGKPEGGMDSCQGDSGGPYVLKENGQSWAAGIVSWGISCGDPGKYGVYTRVANYIDWIKKTMEEEEKKTVCGRPVVSVEMHQRILGGMLAPKGSFPWQVLLNVDGGRAGGMVIDHKWILTAASNLMRGDNQILKSQVKVFVGDNNVRNLTQSTPLEVASLHIHPGYNNPNYLSYDNDIALIKLQKSLQFSSNIMRVCLPVKGAEYTIGRVGWVSGFGLEEDDIISVDLRYVRVPLVSQLTCRRSIDEERAKTGEAPDLTDNMFCAGLPEGGKDACGGDGGSPYVLKYGGVYWAAGIASWGLGCGEPGRYGVYTRVDKYSNWIKKTIEEEEQKTSEEES